MPRSITCARGVGSMNDNLTRWTSLGGILLLGTAEAATEFPVRYAGDFVTLFGNVSSNGHTTATTTLMIRRSQANTNLFIDILAGVTGYVEETAIVESFAATDEVSVQIATGANPGTTAITFQVLGGEYLPTDRGTTLTFMGVRGSINVSTASQTNYMTPLGYNDAVTTTEADRKFRMRTAGTLSNMWVNVSANARTTTTDFRTRINGANGTQLVQFTSLTTGSLEDTDSTDSIVVGDDLDYSVTTGTGTETLTFQMVACPFVNAAGEFILGSAASSAVNSGLTQYFAVGGRTLVNGTENQIEMVPHTAFFAKELAVMITANTLNSTEDVFALRYQGATTSLDLRPTGGAQVLVNSNIGDRVFIPGSGAATDTLSVRVITTASSSGTITTQWIAFVCSSQKGQPLRRPAHRLFNRRF